MQRTIPDPQKSMSATLLLEVENRSADRKAIEKLCLPLPFLLQPLLWTKHKYVQRHFNVSRSKQRLLGWQGNKKLLAMNKRKPST